MTETKVCFAERKRGIFQFTSFSAGVVAVFSNREFDAEKNIKAFLDALQISAGRYVTVKQVHEDRVVIVGSATGTEAGEADALIAEEKGRVLVIRTADCVPVFLFDPERQVVGLAHAGWRGLRKGVVSKTVEALHQRFGSKPWSLEVALGPAIREPCYEVSQEFTDHFPGQVRLEEGHYFFDLVGGVKRQLVECGIRESQMADCGLCTFCSGGDFFSARREGSSTGRLVSAIWLTQSQE